MAGMDTPRSNLPVATAGSAPASWQQRAAALREWVAYVLDGDLARVDPADRGRMMEWQEVRTRSAMLHLFQMLAVLATVKVALVMAGAWPVAAPPLLYAGALFVLLGALAVFQLGRSRGTDALTATLFVLALLVVLVDVPGGDLAHPGVTMACLVLLPAVGVPLLVRRHTALLLGAFCIVVVGIYLLLIPQLRVQWLNVLLYLAVALVAGFKLRRARSNMSVGHLRTVESALLRANTDALTGLLNRRGWLSAARARLDSMRMDGGTACLLFIDLDHFKRFNDTHGHEAGDLALQRTGRAIRARLDGRSIAARIGGEEFVCLLPDVSLHDARRLAERLQRDLGGDTPPITFSAGLAERRADETLSQLMARGDRAMYEAKRAGRDRVMQDAA